MLSKQLSQILRIKISYYFITSMDLKFKKDKNDKPFWLAWDSGYSWDTEHLVLKPRKFWKTRQLDHLRLSWVVLA